MKKIFLVLTLFIVSTVLVACSKPDNTVLISKYFESINIVNNSIELYNYGEQDAKLKNYKLEIYQNGDIEATYSIPLSGTLAVGEFYLITADNATDSTLTEKSDLASADLLFNGNDAVALVYDGDIVDVIGLVGSSLDFGKDATLIRKDSSMMAYSEFSSYNFINYQPDLFQYAKNSDYPISTNEGMVNGPRLTDEYRDLPFIDPNNPDLGGGGAIEVTLSTVADGDTAAFYSLDRLTYYRVRFFFIDTKEVAGTGSVMGQPWGYPASSFTKDILYDAKDNGKKIEIQSIKGNSLLDGYERFLGLVWVDGELVNYMVVRAGLSDANAANPNSNLTSMAYQGIPYYAFLQNAWERASINQWGIHTPADPNWDYTQGKPILPISVIPDARLYNSEIDD